MLIAAVQKGFIHIMGLLLASKSNLDLYVFKLRLLILLDVIAKVEQLFIMLQYRIDKILF